MSRLLASILERARRPVAKVCGLTRQADIEPVARAGADFIGLVSHVPSPRHLSDLLVVALAHSIRQAGVRSVLVTVNADRSAVDQLVHEARLDAVQLCGSETPHEWRNTPYGLLRRIAVDEHGRAELTAWRGIADAFVLDHPSSAGGSGRAVDLVLAARLADEAPCLLAGGLNAAAAVFAAELRGGAPAAPFTGFDASSGLESNPGVKDMSLVESFVAAAHRYPFTARS